MHRRLPPASAAEMDVAASLAPVLERWFEQSTRDLPWRAWGDEFRIAVTELLLQRTRAETVAAFVPGFLRRYPSWAAILRADQLELEGDLAALGLQRRRAEALTAMAAAALAGVPAGDALKSSQYIGRAIRVMAHGGREAMVDSNFVRVFQRVFSGAWASDYRRDRRLQALAQTTVDAASDPRAINWAVLDLGAAVCVPRRPRCSDCPLSSRCHAAVAGPEAGGRDELEQPLA